MPTSFLDEARQCRRVARELTGTTEAAFLLKIACEFEDLHAMRAEPARGRQTLEDCRQVSARAQDTAMAGEQ